jgi:hypothetical protein
MESKARQLEALLKDMAGVLVAFSGGVDSSVLLATAHEALGERAVAATGMSASFPAHDLEFARTISAKLGVRWIIVDSGELEDQRYKENPPNRCYFCKKSLFSRLIERALQKQSAGFVAMLSFRVPDSSWAERIINRVRVITFAESLGGVESLITYPVRQTHGDIPVEIREKFGVTDDLLRLSVGIEHVSDLIGDLEQAMET